MLPSSISWQSSTSPPIAPPELLELLLEEELLLEDEELLELDELLELELEELLELDELLDELVELEELLELEDEELELLLGLASPEELELELLELSSPPVHATTSSETSAEKINFLFINLPWGVSPPQILDRHFK